MDYGIDACGAGLFCAAFDGRTQATCYPERSRPDMEECAADAHCASGSCNTTVGRCQSSPFRPCEVGVGCADTDDGGFVCIDGECDLTEGVMGSPCERDDDCDDGVCDGSTCLGAEGSVGCTEDADCQSSLCCEEQDYAMVCDPCGGGEAEGCIPGVIECEAGLECCNLGWLGHACFATCAAP
jgi:hypothetical protein